MLLLPLRRPCLRPPKWRSFIESPMGESTMFTASTGSASASKASRTLATVVVLRRWGWPVPWAFFGWRVLRGRPVASYQQTHKKHFISPKLEEDRNIIFYRSQNAENRDEEEDGDQLVHLRIRVSKVNGTIRQRHVLLYPIWAINNRFNK